MESRYKNKQSKWPQVFLKTLVIASVFLFSCEESPLDEYSQFQSSLIVEGIMETDLFARVIITRNIPYYFELDSTNMLDFIIRQARVEVSDGEQSEYLTLRYNANYFPPYFYQGRYIRGEAGKEYTLTIHFGELELTSKTTIPDRPVIDSAWFEPAKSQPGYGTINVSVINQSNTEVYYRFYTMTISESRLFHPTLLSNFDSRFFSQEEVVLSLNKGPASFMDMEDAEFLFNAEDTVILKVCRMNREQYLFWESYQEEVFGGSNPFTSGSRQVRSNINGGYGNWGGFSTYYYTIYPEID